MDGVSLLPTIRNPNRRPNRALEIEALEPLFPEARSRSTPGTGRTRACAPTSTPTSSGPRPARRSCTTATADPYQLTNVAADPAYAEIKAQLAAKLAELDDCSGNACNVAP